MLMSERNFQRIVGLRKPFNHSVTNCACEGKLTVTKCGNVTVPFGEPPRKVDTFLN